MLRDLVTRPITPHNPKDQLYVVLDPTICVFVGTAGCSDLDSAGTVREEGWKGGVQQLESVAVMEYLVMVFYVSGPMP